MYLVYSICSNPDPEGGWFRDVCHGIEGGRYDLPPDYPARGLLETPPLPHLRHLVHFSRNSGPLPPRDQGEAGARDIRWGGGGGGRENFSRLVVRI